MEGDGRAMLDEDGHDVCYVAFSYLHRISSSGYADVAMESAG
jgi:hypothetical protein